VPRDEISFTLDVLKGNARGIRSVFLTSVQGKFLGSTQLTGMEKIQLGGICAASLAIATKGLTDLQLGRLKQVHIVGDGGSILLLNVGLKALLTVVAEDGVNLDPLLEEAKKAALRLTPLV
jgi:predicted regulator of Ras-like GTPase activity (Roadblock/LC7/MglB family)